MDDKKLELAKLIDALSLDQIIYLIAFIKKRFRLEI